MQRCEGAGIIAEATTSEEFDCVRDRADFHKLVAEMEAKQR